jgi:hypothetical protein
MFNIILTKSRKAPASLSLDHLIVYSKLAFATHAVSIPILAKWTRLSEREVDLCLAELSALGLIYRDCGGAAAIEPPDGWFVTRRNFTKATWAHRTAYWMLFPSANGELTSDEAAVWSFVFTANNISQIVPNSYISQGTGLPEPTVVGITAALVQRGLVREITGFRLAFYDSHYGQVLDEAATVAANKRSCIGNAKDQSIAKPKGGLEDLEALLDEPMRTAGVNATTVQPPRPTTANSLKELSS